MREYISHVAYFAVPLLLFIDLFLHRYITVAFK